MLRRVLASRAVCALVAVCIAVPAGYGLLWPLGRLFDLAHLPVFNTWALMHASAIIAWPALSLLVAYGAWLLIRRGQRRLNPEKGARRDTF